MKQTWRRLAALLCILCFFTLYGAAEDKPTVQELVAQWATTQYPDDVGSIYHGEDNQQIVIGLVDGSEERREELRAMVSNPGSLSFDEADYPYNDLLAVKEEISKEFSSNKWLYSVSVGWTSAEGTGFGPNGKDFRVVVEAEAGKLAYYQTLYEERYGGMVVVVEGSPAVIAIGVVPWYEQGWTAALLLLLAAGGALLLLARLRAVRARRRADGGTDAPHGPISRRAAEQAVRESAASPPEQVLERLLERMQNRPSHLS